MARAYIKFDPVEWASVSGGRIPNPWFSTDLVWDEDLNFDGVAVNLRSVTPTQSLRPFATAGWFPLRADNPPNAEKQWLAGGQIGAEYDLSSSTRLRLGLAKYHYSRIEARTDTNFDAIGPLPGYGRYEHSSALRQKGNTLVLTNPGAGAAFGETTPIYGLASKFEPWVLTATADLAHFDPVHVLLSAEYVKNTGFDRGDILRRTGLNLTDGKDTAYHVRLMVGMPSVWKVVYYETT